MGKQIDCFSMNNTNIKGEYAWYLHGQIPNRKNRRRYKKGLKKLTKNRELYNDFKEYFGDDD